MVERIFQENSKIRALVLKKIFCERNYNIQKGKTQQISQTLNEETAFNLLVDYRYNLRFKILKSNRDEIILESYELSLPHANSLRRILLGEIETMAIERVFFYYNSSILNDEIIAHRLGLVPIAISSKILNKNKKTNDDPVEKIILEFKVKNPKKSFRKISVYSRSIRLKNYGLYFSMNKNCPVNPVFRDLLILKLNPGQKIKCECHCIIGSGSNHAKFSPVGTAFYRISPKVKIVGELFNQSAEIANEICPVKVFDIKFKGKKNQKILNVKSPQFCTLCKECLKTNFNSFRPIRISRIRNKVTFVIESTGVLAPEVLFHRAASLLIGKCNKSLSILFKSTNFNDK